MGTDADEQSPVDPDAVPPELRAALASRYVVERLLGQGGTANVFLATDRRHRRRVALKVLRSEVAAVLGTDRFLHEITTVASLSHPHILPLHDSGEAGGLLYFVMPFVEGESLRDRMEREGRLPVDDVVRIVSQVADALAYAHEQGVVHRDIKPENILLLAGHAVLTDFGIARGTLTAGSRLTEVGFRLGTPAYMSPEAYCDDDIDGRADVYGLGVVLYEALVGQTPFGGPTLIAMLSRKSTGEFLRLGTLRGDLPPGVEVAVARALAPDPADRFATAREFRDALTAPVALPEAEGAATDRRTVAVLPFANDPGNADAAYLCDGLTDELIHALSRVPGLRVVARTSVFALRDAGLDAPAIGRRLQADVLLDGSVRARGDRLRVTVELVDARDGLELWNERWDRTMEDVFAVEDEITAAVTRRLADSLTGDRPTAMPRRTIDPQAYEQYLRGRHLWNQRTEESLRRSVLCFDEALARDPSMSTATAGRATALATLALYGFDPPAAVAEALATTDRALGDPASRSEALATRGCLRALHRRQWRPAEADFLAAIAANPHDPVAPHWYAANLLLPLGRWEEAERQLDQARKLDPLSPAINATVGLRHLLEGAVPEGITRLQDVLSYATTFPMVHYFMGLGWLAGHDPGRATVALQEAVDRTGGAPEALSVLAVARAGAGEHAAAEALLARLGTMAESRYVSPTLFAQAHAALGRFEEAFMALERAVAEGALDVVWVDTRPTFASLRADPAYAGIRTALGLDRARRSEETAVRR